MEGSGQSRISGMEDQVSDQPAPGREEICGDTFSLDPPIHINPRRDNSTPESDAYAERILERVFSEAGGRDDRKKSDGRELLAALRTYRDARQTFLRVLGCDTSNRDPLAEFAERLAHAILGGAMAPSRVHKHYDLTTDDGRTVQVRYLANPVDKWVNEHVVDFRQGVDLYALLIVEALDARTLLVFERDTVGSVAAALGKKHPDQDTTIQFTRVNYQQLLREEEKLAGLGVQIYRL